MAVIEYRITVDENGNATVVQDVRAIGLRDSVIFSTDGKNVSPGKQMAIRYVDASPFVNGGPLPGLAFPVAVTPNSGATPVAEGIPVDKSNLDDDVGERFTPVGMRKAFHFECGEIDTDVVIDPGGRLDQKMKQDMRNKSFRAWGGGGGDNPGTGGTL